MPSSTSNSNGARVSASTVAKRSLLALVAVFLAIHAVALIVWQAMPLTPVSTGRYLSAVDDHVAMLERSKGEKGRIILLGGSGAAFSISAEALNEALDRPVYNGGIQAGIGFRNLTDLYVQHFDPKNDLIVILPEPELLADDERYSQTWCDTIFLRKALGDLFQQPRCVPFILHRTYQEVRHHISGETAIDPVYRRSGFNAVGDLTSHLSLDNPTPDFTDYGLPMASDAKLNRFQSYVQETLIARGLSVLYIPAAMPKPACQRQRDQLAQMVGRLSALTTIKSEQYDIDRFCLTSDLFFDGAGHLNRKGRAIQTENVRRALAQALAVSSAN